MLNSKMHICCACALDILFKFCRVSPPPSFNYSCRQLFARALKPSGKSLEIYMKKAGVPSYLPIEHTHSDRLFGWAKPILF